MGHDVPGRDVIPLLSGDVRPEMVAALRAHQDEVQDRLHHQQRAVDAGGQREHPDSLYRREIIEHVRSFDRVRPRSASASPIRASIR